MPDIDVPNQPAEALPISVALWNPNAAANWSVLFTPAFGAYLQMLNWRALGKPREAAVCRNWVYATLGLLALILVLGYALPPTKAFEGVNRSVGIGFLLGWYFTSARNQVKYIRETFGDDYPRKPWAKALACGVGFLLGCMALAFVVTVGLGMAASLPE